MNRGQLVTRISQILGLATSGDDTEITLIQDMVNEAVVDILARTRINVRCTNITLTAGVKEYEIGQQVLRLYDVYRGTTLLQEVAPGDVNEAGSGSYTQVGYNLIHLGWSPDPTDSYGLVITAWYTPRPSPMILDDHDPSTSTYGGIPPEFHKAIIDYACWWLADYAGDQGSARGDKYRTKYEGQDGMAGLPSDLGQIKLSINRRSHSGSSQSRRRRSGERIFSDGFPNYWIG